MASPILRKLQVTGVHSSQSAEQVENQAVATFFDGSHRQQLGNQTRNSRCGCGAKCVDCHAYLSSRGLGAELCGKFPWQLHACMESGMR